jgi:transposase-like protein
VKRSGEVEGDEVSSVAGPKGRPFFVAQQPRPGGRRRLKGSPGRGTVAGEKPPIFGMIQRNGEVGLHRLENGQPKPIQPILTKTIQLGSPVFTDEYNRYARLKPWGYNHQTVNHAQGEYARDEDGDGFHEVHVNPMEGFWSLLCSWLRPPRGISQEHLPLYLAFFEFIHNIRRRGKALLGSLLALLLAP